MTLLKKIGYGLMIGSVILWLFKDWIDLITYGRLHALLYLIFWGSIIFLLVAMIIEWSRSKKRQLSNTKSNWLFTFCFIVFSLFFIFRPYNPHVGVKYDQVWVWKGWYDAKHYKNEPAIWSVFNAHGTLKLAHNGKFMLIWRSMFNSWNYYGDWRYEGNTLRLFYVGRKNKRVGTDLFYYGGSLSATNIPNDFAPQVILTRVN
jgi:hypothetical protein